MSIVLLTGQVLLSVECWAQANESVGDSEPTSESNWSLGPFQIPNQYPLALLHSSFIPDSPEILEEGNSSLISHFSWSNTFNKEKSYQVDTESRVLELAWNYGLDADWQAGIRVPLVWRGGGVLDSAIDSWHSAFGLPKGYRNDVEDNEYNINGINTDNSSFDLSDEGTHLGDISLSAKYQFSAGDDVVPASALVTSLRLPTGAKSFGQDAVDLDFQLLASKQLAPFFIYGGAGYSLFGDTRTDGVIYERHHVSAFVGAELPIVAELHAYTGIQYASALLKDLPNFPPYQTYLDIGLKYRASPSVYEFYIRENPGPSKGTTDFTFGMGLRLDFPK